MTAGKVAGADGRGDWNDDAEYHRAVGRAWVTTAFASCCALGTRALVALAVSGAGVLVAVVEALD